MAWATFSRLKPLRGSMTSESERHMTSESERQRRERLRVALRENLKRRKAQIRGRQAEPGEAAENGADFAKPADPGKEPDN
jgi:hypothetical protein